MLDNKKILMLEDDMEDVMTFHYDYCLPNSISSTHPWISRQELVEYILITQDIDQVLNFVRFQEQRWIQVTNREVDNIVVNYSMLVHCVLFCILFGSENETLWDILATIVTSVILGYFYGHIAIETRRAYRSLASSRSPKENRFCCI